MPGICYDPKKKSTNTNGRKGTNGWRLQKFSACNFMSLEHKMSGTLRPRVEPSQTAKFRFFFKKGFYQSLASSCWAEFFEWLFVTTDDKVGVNLTLISAGNSVTAVFYVCKIAPMDILANLPAYTGGGLQSKTFQIWGSSHERQTN